MTERDEGSRDAGAEQDRPSLAQPSSGDPPTSATAASSGTRPTNNDQTPLLPSENGTTAAAKSSNVARSLNVSNSPSTASPFSSRDSSPSRPNPKSSQMGAPVPKRSRHHSKDVSPSRPPALPGVSATIPSAAAIQRALSSAVTPQLQPSQGPELKAPRPQKPLAGASGENNPHWPVSPRLKSPPPTVTRSRKNSANSLRAQAQQQASQTARTAVTAVAPSGSAPNIVVQSSTPPPPSSVPRLLPKHEVNGSDSEDQAPLTMKLSARGIGGPSTMLETVQESSVPSTPSMELLESQRAMHNPTPSKLPEQELSDASAAKVSEDLSSKSKSAESGSDSSGNKSVSKRSTQVPKSTPKPGTLSSRNSFSTLVPSKTRAEAGSKNMTVETETVSSIPQGPIGAQGERNATGRSEATGTLKMKPSAETIRPKKERKKQARKPPSINSGTASTKADIFEIKVAKDLDANSSDSDETFVYESNPPDSQTRTIRHHSRTPSATSMTSLGDSTRNMRSIGNVLESNRSVPSKRSMKFAHNPYNSVAPDPEHSDRGDGTLRLTNGRTSGGSSIHHHHIGRFGRNGTSHTSLFDGDGPFPQTGKGRAASSRQSSRPTSPRFANFPPRVGNGVSKENGALHLYDMEGEGADDERTPLISTVRGPRTRTPRRPNSASLRQLEHYQRHQGSWLRRCAGCIVMTVMVLLLVCGAVGFLFATTKPLYGVGIREIQNVLATEQEIMLDLLVEAINPNVIAVTVSDMDVSVFAKSKHVGTDKWWREHGSTESESPWRSPRTTNRKQKPTSGYQTYTTSNTTSLISATEAESGRDDDPDDDDDDSGESSTMLLGRIFHFDSALVFEGSAVQRHAHYSVGQVRLSKPGNKTEAGGTERWERVMKYPFELIVRGVLKYELPLSSRMHTTPIGASVIVRPSKGVDDGEQTPGGDIGDGGDDGDDNDDDNKNDGDGNSETGNKESKHWW